MSYRQYRDVEANERILCFVDTCAGGGDRTAAQFLSNKKLDVPLVYHSPVTTSDYIPVLVRTLEYISDITHVRPTVALERNNGGAFLTDRLAQLNYMGKYEMFKMPMFGSEASRYQESTKYGWDTNSVTRPKMLQELKDAVDKQVVTLYDRATITEMFSFVVNQRNTSWKAQAESGAKDDLVMSLAGVWQIHLFAQNETSDHTFTSLAQQLPKQNLFNKGGFY